MSKEKSERKKIAALFIGLVIFGTLIGIGIYLATQPEVIPEIIPPVVAEEPTPTPTPTPEITGKATPTSEITPTPTPRYGRRRGSVGGGAVTTPTPTPTPTPESEPETHNLLVCDEDYVCRPEGCTEPLLTVSNIMPGMDKDCEVMSLKNNGTDNATAYMKFYGVNGELADYLVFGVIVTENGAGLKAEGNLTALNNQEIELGEIVGGEFLKMRICWLLPGETPNEAQGKPLTFDIDYYLQ